MHLRSPCGKASDVVASVTRIGSLGSPAGAAVDGLVEAGVDALLKIAPCPVLVMPWTHPTSDGWPGAHAEGCGAGARHRTLNSDSW